MKTITSSMFSLKTKDFLRALLIAMVAPIIPIITNSLSAREFTINWHNIISTSVGAGLAYLGKNFFTPAQIVITGNEVTKAIEEKKAQDANPA